MTRSSWHCFWMLMTLFSAFLCGFFILAAVSTSAPPGAGYVAPLGQAASIMYYAFAQALATLLALFWGIAAVSFGLAWSACSMALRERKAGIDKAKQFMECAREVTKGMPFDALFRS